MTRDLPSGIVKRVRAWSLLLVVGACSREAPAPASAPAVTAPTNSPAAGDSLPDHQSFPDLGAALTAVIPPDARVVGIGELHARTDRKPSRSSLAAFTQALPAVAGKLSDLVIETWLVDPTCGKAAVQTTTKVETMVKRPETTKSEIAVLADAAREARIQPHAMTLACADYAAITPSGGEVDPVALLSLTTRELTRIATSAVVHRDREPGHRPWIAVYGGALHNDRFPDASVAEWSYAAEVDRITGGHFVEIDVIVPEIAAADPKTEREPWFPLVRAARDPARPVVVWTRGERSFVVILPPT